MAPPSVPADHGATGPAETDAPSAGRRPPRSSRWSAGWRSRALITAAYLLTLSGLGLVAALGTELRVTAPINEGNGDLAVANDLLEVMGRAMAPAAPQPRPESVSESFPEQSPSP